MAEPRPVSDSKAEAGILAGNIISIVGSFIGALILAAILTFGNRILSAVDNLTLIAGALTTITSLNKNDIITLKAKERDQDIKIDQNTRSIIKLESK